MRECTMTELFRLRMYRNSIRLEEKRRCEKVHRHFLREHPRAWE